MILDLLVRGPRRFVFLSGLHSNLTVTIVKICRWIEWSSGANDSQGVKLQMSSWLWSWLRWLAVLWWLWFSIGKSRLPILNETLLAKQGGFRKTIRKFCDFKQHGWTFVNNVKSNIPPSVLQNTHKENNKFEINSGMGNTGLEFDVFLKKENGH